MPVLHPCALASLLAILSLALAGTPVAAQPWRASVLALPQATVVAADSTGARPDRAARAVAHPRQPSIVAPIVGGALGAGLGAVGGVVFGASLDRHASDDIPVSAVLGFVVGEALVLPLGVHVGNGGRGNLLADLGASIGGGLFAIALGGAFHDGAAYLVGLGGQLGFTLWAERHAAAHKARVLVAPADTTRHMTSMPLPPPEPEPLLPPPLPTK